MPRFIRLPIGLMVLALSACAVQQARLGHIELSDITHWEAKGKISVSVPGERKSANFSWLNQGEDFDIRLHGPLGSGAAKLQKRGRRVTLTDGKQKHLANSAEALLAETTGWVLPISELRWWIKALPSPESPHTESMWSDEGLLVSQRQQGWHLRYKSFASVSGHRLPGKIIATRDGIKLVIAVKQWTLKGP